MSGGIISSTVVISVRYVFHFHHHFFSILFWFQVLVQVWWRVGGVDASYYSRIYPHLPCCGWGDNQGRDKKFPYPFSCRIHSKGVNLFRWICCFCIVFFWNSGYMHKNFYWDICSHFVKNHDAIIINQCKSVKNK